MRWRLAKICPVDSQKATEGYANKAAEEKLNICIERLLAEFGESKKDKCRRLAAELSAIKDGAY